MYMIYGIGASVVVLGALFKINHYPYAELLLIIGLGTEAIIFLLSAFAPMPAEYEWEKAYPELMEGAAPKKKIAANGKSTSAQLDHLLESNNIGSDLVSSLGKGMSKLSQSASQLAKIGDASIATDEYAVNVKQASKSLVDMNKSYGNTLVAMDKMASASKDAEAYHTQMQSVTVKLAALNALYEMELQDANGHLKAMNKFYANISGAMNNVADAAKNAEKFKVEMGNLTTNLSSLNNVYGSMLTAMKNV
jgi:gliding motility-associated protein GldL